MSRTRNGHILGLQVSSSLENPVELAVELERPSSDKVSLFAKFAIDSGVS